MRRVTVALCVGVVGVLGKRHGGKVGTAGVDGAGLQVYTSPGAMALNELDDLDAAVLASAVLEPSADDPNNEFVGENPDQSPYVEPGQEEVEAARARGLNVFLPDTRVLVNSKVYPGRAVGRYGGCTATLIYDKAIIVTNAHCLKFTAAGKLDPSQWNTVFYAGFNKGTFVGSSTPKALWYDRRLDYAVLKLKVDLSLTLGRFGTSFASTVFFVPTRPLSMISYSGDHCGSWSTCVAKQCSGKSRGLVLVSSSFGSPITSIRHDCDAKRGSSGSSMFHMVGIIPVQDALNNAEFRGGGELSLTLPSYTDNRANLARPASDWKAGYDKVKGF